MDTERKNMAKDTKTQPVLHSKPRAVFTCAKTSVSRVRRLNFFFYVGGDLTTEIKNFVVLPQRTISPDRVV